MILPVIPFSSINVLPNYLCLILGTFFCAEEFVVLLMDERIKRRTPLVFTGRLFVLLPHIFMNDAVGVGSRVCFLGVLV